MIQVLTCTGGASRGLVVPGILLRGQLEGKLDLDKFDVLSGDSFGAFIMALLASGWTVNQMVDLFLRTDFKPLLTILPWAVRLPLMAVKPISLDKVIDFLETLNLKPDRRLYINAWDGEANEQVIYCTKKPDWFVENPCVPTRVEENAFPSARETAIKIARSMALPGLVADDAKYLDGGLGEHPPLSFLPRDSKVLALNLGFAGKVPSIYGTVPTGLFGRAFYAVDIIQWVRQKYEFFEFPNLTQIDPEIYDIDPLKGFGLSPDQKAANINRASSNTALAWKLYTP